MCSYLASGICAMCCARTSNITTAPGHISRWAKTHRSRGLSRRSVAFFRCRSSADCTIVTSGSDFRQRQHGAAKATSLARLENVLLEPRGWNRLNRFVCGSDDLISAALRIARAGPPRRRILLLGVTTQPAAEWIARQVTEACDWESAPQYLIRDRDRVYGEAFTRRIRAMGIRDRPIAPRSPWQNCYAERLIGSIRRECLDHVIVFGERHLRHVLRSYEKYYNDARTHLSLDKDSPVTRSVQPRGSILPLPILGGLHHHYIRI